MKKYLYRPWTCIIVLFCIFFLIAVSQGYSSFISIILPDIILTFPSGFILSLLVGTTLVVIHHNNPTYSAYYGGSEVSRGSTTATNSQSVWHLIGVCISKIGVLFGILFTVDCAIFVISFTVFILARISNIFIPDVGKDLISSVLAHSLFSSLYLMLSSVIFNAIALLLPINRKQNALWLGITIQTGLIMFIIFIIYAMGGGWNGEDAG